MIDEEQIVRLNSTKKREIIAIFSANEMNVNFIFGIVLGIFTKQKLDPNSIDLSKALAGAGSQMKK